MLYTAAILFTGIGGFLLLASFFILLFNILVEVLKGKEIDIEAKMERYVAAGVIIGVMLVVFGGVLLGADAFLKPL